MLFVVERYRSYAEKVALVVATYALQDTNSLYEPRVGFEMSFMVILVSLSPVMPGAVADEVV